MDVFDTGRHRQRLPEIGAKLKHQRQVQLLSRSGPLGFIEPDMIGLLMRAKSGSQFVFIITDGYSKLTHGIPKFSI